MTVDIERQSGVVIGRLNNPPVNALSAAVRSGLARALDEAEAAGVPLVLTGAPFSAGADVTEFGRPPVPPLLPDLLLRIERASVPVVAAIDGMALGGGLELALACDHRAAAPGARLGLPEVTLGLIPGAGGTQRLPRLIVAEAALRMITEGKPVSAEEGLLVGLVDAVSEDPLTAALQLARSGKRDRGAAADYPEADAFAQARAAMRERFPLEPARVAAVDAVEAATQMPLDEGLAEERRLFAAMMDTPASRGLRHAFAAERAAAKLPDHARDAAPLEVRTAAVIGAGSMGRGIALALARAGVSVTVVDRSRDALVAAEQANEAVRTRDVEKGRLDAMAAKAERSRIAYAEAMPKGAALYVEAVFEEAGVKRAVLEDAAEAGGAAAILATNTSYLDVDALADAVPDPSRVLGLHFFNPAHLMRLLEVIEGPRTAPDVLATGFALAKRMRKVPVRAGVCHGFIGNRCFQAYQREAGLMLLEGAAPERIDAAMRGFGMPMGPFEVLDLAGLDVGTSMRAACDPADYEPRGHAVHDALTGEGKLGRKSGEGFYRYEGRERTASARPAELAERLAAAHGVERRELSGDEIVDRCALAISLEGFRLLAEGIALREGDVDAVLLHGYGYPRARGRPLFYARERGLADVAERARAFAQTAPGGPRRWALPPQLTADS
jgi:3-hydroxyacyl-CoA dehydrogenase